jgi:small neutral amino acid transporter SnatA (MarC family)
VVIGEWLKGQDRAVRLADATKAALAVLVILTVAALVGARVLQVFGGSLDAFSVAGGGVLSWIGLTMLGAKSAPDQDPSKDGADEKREEETVYASQRELHAHARFGTARESIRLRYQR